MEYKIESGGTLRGSLNSIEMLKGYSAFEVAVINGFSGTEEEWLESLKGESGYQIAVRYGYTGTEAEFFADLTNFATLAEETKTAEQNAKASETNASASAVSAANDAAVAQSAKTAAKQSATNAANSETEAKKYADQAASAAGGGVTSFNGRGGNVVPQSGDYTPDMVGAVNPNLLHNWYFIDPIDQRNGHFIPGGTTTYTDPALTSVTDKPPEAPKMVEVFDTYATYTTSKGEPRYVPLSAVRRGYCGQIQMFDRWCGNNGGANCEITGSSVKFIPSPTSGNYSMIQQIIENPEKYLGKTVTLSILYASGELKTDTGVVPDAFPSSEQYLCQVGNATLRLSSSKFRIMVSVPSTSNGSEYAAMKLELGSVQTLARQEDGRWVLNEIPDKGLELLRCIQSTADSTDDGANKTIMVTSDKPSGSWTGNKSIPRTINTGGIGEVISVRVEYGDGSHGAIYYIRGDVALKVARDGTVTALTDHASFSDGVLTLNHLNVNGSTSAGNMKYYYQVL